MNDRDIRRYDRTTRVITFGKANDADFTADSLARGHFAAIATKLVEIDKATAGQTPARVSKETLLDALMLDFKRIAATARSIEKKSGETGFAAAYPVPDRTEIAITTHADKVLGLLEDQDSDTAAQKTAKAALRARFLAFELAANFVQRLRDDRDAIGDANIHNRDEVNEGVENTALIGLLLGEINEEIDFLETIMGNKYERQPEKLRAWDSASRVERAPVKAKKIAPTNSAPPAPTPVPAPQPVLQPA